MASLCIICRRRRRQEDQQRLRLRVRISNLEMWGSLVERLRRLKFKRKCWAFLGHHLNYIKTRGKILCEY